MPRTPRRRAESDIYHVIARGNAKQTIFEDDADRSRFLELLGMVIDEDFEVLAYCLMGDHVHLLIRSSMDALASKCRCLLSGYASWFNLRHGRCGHLFQGRFISEPVEDDAYLLSVVRYIHKNPEKASLGSATLYRWSSYSDYMRGGGLASTFLVIGFIGLREAFASFHERDEELEPRVRDMHTSRKMMRDEDALRKAKEVLGAAEFEQVKALSRDERDAALRRLKAEGLGVRQIQRLTGISLGVISKA